MFSFVLKFIVRKHGLVKPERFDGVKMRLIF